MDIDGNLIAEGPELVTWQGDYKVENKTDNSVSATIISKEGEILARINEEVPFTPSSTPGFQNYSESDYSHTMYSSGYDTNNHLISRTWYYDANWNLIRFDTVDETEIMEASDLSWDMCFGPVGYLKDGSQLSAVYPENSNPEYNYVFICKDGYWHNKVTRKDYTLVVTNTSVPPYAYSRTKMVCQHRSDDIYCAINSEGVYGAIDSNGNVVIPFEYEDYVDMNYNDTNYILVKKDGAWHFYDITTGEFTVTDKVPEVNNVPASEGSDVKDSSATINKPENPTEEQANAIDSLNKLLADASLLIKDAQQLGSDLKNTLQSTAGSGSTVSAIYDISFVNGSDTIDANDTMQTAGVKVTVKIPLSAVEGLTDAAKNSSVEISVYYIDRSNNKATKMTSKVDEGYLTFDTDHFSDYAIVITPKSIEEHTYASDWSYDNNSHWHACTVAGHTDKSGTAAHTWNGGEVTKAATATEKGVKTYTCTVCKKTKTEDIPVTCNTSNEGSDNKDSNKNNSSNNGSSSSSSSNTTSSNSSSSSSSATNSNGSNTSSSNTSNTVATTTVYRLYNPNSGEHLYTTDKNEYDTLGRIGWKQENVAWNSPASGDAVYRLYNPNSGDHHYTKDLNEYNTLAGIGWKQEGVKFYSSTATDKVTVYRLYNPNLKVGTHHYTTDKNEYDTLAKLGWKQEGIGFYSVK
jgi:hypothetical protein